MAWLLLLACLFQTHLLPTTAPERPAHPEIAFRIMQGGICLAYSPDGKTVATGNQDQTLQLWDARSGELLHTLSIPEPARSLAFSPDSATLLCRCSTSGREEAPINHVLLCDVASGKLLRPLGSGNDNAYQNAGVGDAVYSPDGRIIAVSAQIWTGANSELDLWDAHTGALLHHLILDSGFTGTLAFSPDGGALAATFTHSDPHYLSKIGMDIRLWNVQTGELRQTLSGNGRDIYRVVFSPDGKTLAADYHTDLPADLHPGYIQLWDVQTGMEKQKLVCKEADVYDFAFSPDGKRLASTFLDRHSYPAHLTKWTGTLVLWNLDTAKPAWTLPENGPFYVLAFSPDGSVLATTDAAVVSLWDPKTGALLHKTSFANDPVISYLKFASDGKTMLTGGDAVRRLDAHNLRILTTFCSVRNTLVPVACSRDGRLLASGGQGGEIAVLWNLRTGRLERHLPHPAPGWVTSVAFSPDGKTLATLTPHSYVAFNLPNELQLWDLQAGRSRHGIEEERVALPPASPVGTTPVATTPDWNTMGFSPDGATVVLGGSATKAGRAGIAWWDLRSGALRRTSAEDTEEVFATAISPTGKLLATSGLYQTILWDAVSDKPIWKKRTLFPGGALSSIWDAGQSRALAFSPDGRTLAGGDTGRVRLWDVATGDEIAQMEGHTRPIKAVAFSPDGALLASASEDGTVRLWDMSTHTTRSVLTHDSPVTSVIISPNGRLLASGSLDGKLCLWNPETGKLLLTMRVFHPRGSQSPIAWIAYMPEGYYDGSSTIKDLLCWRVGDRFLPYARFAHQYHRPDLVQAAIQAH